MMNLPPEFVNRTKSLLGTEWDSFVVALDEVSPVSIRLNRAKRKDIIDQQGYRVPWCDTGYYLEERPQFTFDPLFHAGCYYVQEASSMFVQQALKQYTNRNIKVLDLCAAPGGKSTLIADWLDQHSLLVSNEVIRSRAHILAENLTKWGNPNVVVTNNDPAELGKLKSYFDVILVDAPCSGEGMFRKDEGAVAEWSLDNVALCKARQQRILTDVWPALKSGGILIYSTCTYNLEENEENLHWICDELGAEALSIDTEAEWGISPSFDDGLPVYRFFPHKTKGEGLFLSILRKKDDVTESVLKRPKNTRDNGKKEKLSSEYKAYLLDSADFTFYTKDNIWNAFPSNLYEDLSLIKPYLNIISEGVCLGEFKGKDLIPSQSLAMSKALDLTAFTRYDIDWRTAINYLRKEALVLPELPKGYILLTFRSVPLGFVKNIGNRANNLYPMEWRIRSANIPENEVKVLV